MPSPRRDRRHDPDMWSAGRDSNPRRRDLQSRTSPLGHRRVWGERRDSNPRHPGPHPGALPTELRPPCWSRGPDSNRQPPGYGPGALPLGLPRRSLSVADAGGFEPPGLITLLFSRQPPSTTRPRIRIVMAERERFELPEHQRVQRLSRAPPSAARPPLRMVGAAGFEPAASWSRTRRAPRLRYTPNGGDGGT